MSKTTTANRLRQIMVARGLKQVDILKKCEPICKKNNIKMNRNDLSQYVNGKVEPGQFKLTVLAQALNVSEVWLMGYDVPMNPRSEANPPMLTDDVVEMPVIGDLAAGYDHIACENWTGDTVLIPAAYLKGRKREDFIVLSVNGDSMYPLYQHGDKVLILKQECVSRSGAVGAVIYRDEFSTLKRVEYGEGWMKLLPINPMYAPVTITGEDLQHVSVIGVPKLLIRDIDE